MEYYKNYIGYNNLYNKNKLGFIPIALAVKAALVVLPKLIPFVSNAFQHPARDANKLIDGIKPELSRLDPRGRLALVLATAEKIPNSARDVRAEKLLLWYKNNYPNDYKSLSFEDKAYYNKVLGIKMQTEADGNGFYANSQLAMFTNNELNYNASTIEKGTNVVNKLVTNISKSPSSLLLYGGLGLGLLLMLKHK
jgi:hypothetical protein